MVPTLSVIIPVHNGGENFRRCLSSLRRADPGPTEIIVVADGDTDGSGKVGEEMGARVLRIPGPQGPARARNEGARTARGEILLFIDADVTVSPDIVDRVVRAFHDHPEVEALIGSYDDAPGEANFLSQYKNLYHHYIHQASRAEASTFWGACGAIRRRTFQDLGGFDESYRRPSIEDIELGYRLVEAGRRIRLDRELRIKHWKRWTPISLVRSDFFDRALPWAGLNWRSRRFINDLNLRWTSRLSVMLAWAVPVSAGLALYRPEFLAVAGALALALVLLNLPVYRFFVGKRGLRFALQAIPWQGLYYFYCGLAFLLSFFRELFLGFPRSAEDPEKGT